jgi:dolichol-phosphate mannosyltransferase
VPAELKDPMSGFFMLRRELLNATVRRLSSVGFKILLDIFASSQTPVRFVEVPYTFRPRHAGESKLDSLAAWDYGMLVLDKLVGHIVPAKFLAFCLIGGLGAVVHFAVLATVFRGFQEKFLVGQAAATVVAMTFNYAVNNLLTFRDRRRRGMDWLTGWLSFSAVCSVGALANVGIASFLFDRGEASWIPAALAGIFVGAVWNYAVSTVITWGARRR